MEIANQEDRIISTDYQILTLYEKARDLIIYQPWTYMSEDHLLVLSTQLNEEESKDLIFCHATGQSEDYYSFSIYIGEQGYEACKEFHDAMSEETPTSKYLNALVRRTCLTLNFVPYNELSEFEKEIFMFVRLLPDKDAYLCPQIRYQVSEGCPSLMIETQLCDQFITILSQLKTIFMQESYTSRISTFKDEEYTVFNIATSEITFSKKPVIKLTPEQPKKFYYLNDLLVYRLKRMPKLPMTIEVIQFYISDSIIFTESQDEARYARVYAFVETDEGQILCLYVQEEETFNPYDVITLLAKDCLRYEFRPDYFVTADEKIYKLLEHFCDQIDVRIQLVEETNVAEEFAENLFEELEEELAEEVLVNVPQQNNELNQKTAPQTNTSDQAINNQETSYVSSEELIISFMTTLYEELMDQHLIIGLSEGGTRHYKQIITIFAIEMQKRGSYNPLEWDASLVFDLIRTRLEVALGMRLFVYAKEVLEYHVTLLGEEEMCANYQDLLVAIEQGFK